MSYHVTGLISSANFLLTIVGLWAQLGFVWRRKQSATEGSQDHERPTAVLSVNQFVSSYLAFFSFFSFFLYGMCLERFNHYLVQEEREERQKAADELIDRQHRRRPLNSFAVRYRLLPLPDESQLRPQSADCQQENFAGERN